MRTSDIVPVTANLHITSACNYRCVFCYAVFPGLRAARGPEEWIDVIRLLAAAPPLLGRYKIDKLTFAGGEPTLVPYLPELLRTTRDAGFVSSLVTNGTGISVALLEACADYLDWVALSIDSPNEDTNALLGRGNGDHVAQTLAAAALLRRYPRIRIKLNTVVTSLNWQEDFHHLVRHVGPERWKVLQATRIEDQNGETIAPYQVKAEQFAAFCRRHADLNPISEREDDIKGSYLMIDPERRFFGNSSGRHVYSEPILRVGVEEAVRQVGWSPDAFVARGGSYEWRKAGPEVRSRRCATFGRSSGTSAVIAGGAKGPTRSGPRPAGPASSSL